MHLRRSLEAGRLRRLGDRAGYWLDRFLGLHPLVQLGSIATLSLLLALAFGAILHAVDRSGAPTVGDGFWWTITRMLDGGTVAGDAGILRRALGLGVSFVGLASVAVLTGAFASVFAERLKELRQGTLPVFERGHVLLLGYNAHAGVVLRELGVGALRLSVVVVADRAREHVEQQIREQLSEIDHRLRVIVRRGDPTSSEVLRRCAARRAHVIVVLPDAHAEDSRRADQSAVRSLLAIRRVVRGRPVPIIVDVAADARDAVRVCAEPHPVAAIDAFEFNARLVASSVQQPGAFDVARQMLSLDHRSLFVHPVARFAQGTFDDAHAAIDDGVVVGIVRAGAGLLSPDGTLALEPQDRLVLFSDRDEPPRGGGSLPEPEESRHEPASTSPSRARELLVVRYRPDIVRVLAQLEASRELRATLLVPPDQLEEARTALSRVHLCRTVVDVEVGDPLDGGIVARMLSRRRDAVLLLAPDVPSGVVAEADADQLLTLLHVRRHRKGNEHVVVEVRSAETPRLAPPHRDGTEDFVLARELVGMLLAQQVHAAMASRVRRSSRGSGERRAAPSEPDAAEQYYQLFMALGERVRLRPMIAYAGAHELPTFGLLMANARARGEIAVGVAEDGDRPRLLPRRDERFNVTGARVVIVLPAPPAASEVPTAAASGA